MLVAKENSDISSSSESLHGHVVFVMVLVDVVNSVDGVVRRDSDSVLSHPAHSLFLYFT